MPIPSLSAMKSRLLFLPLLLALALLSGCSRS
jgi:hypothetical protein